MRLSEEQAGRFGTSLGIGAFASFRQRRIPPWRSFEESSCECFLFVTTPVLSLTSSSSSVDRWRRTVGQRPPPMSEPTASEYVEFLDTMPVHQQRRPFDPQSLDIEKVPFGPVLPALGIKGRASNVAVNSHKVPQLLSLILKPNEGQKIS